MSCLIDTHENLTSSSSISLQKASEPSLNSHLIRNISSIFIEVLNETDQILNPTSTSFDALAIPSITLSDFLTRILKFSYCSPEMLLVALIYIDRLVKTRSDFVVNSRKIHR